MSGAEQKVWDRIQELQNGLSPIPLEKLPANLFLERLNLELKAGWLRWTISAVRLKFRVFASERNERTCRSSMRLSLFNFLIYGYTEFNFKSAPSAPIRCRRRI
jgi:hypothetical protein